MLTALSHNPRRQSGLSLVELLVAMAIGVVILLAASEVMLNNNRTRGEVERTGRQIENGIFALQLLEDDISNAGFWGEANVAAGGAAPPLCPLSEAELRDAMGFPLGAADADGLEADAECGDAPVKAGSRVIAVRRASTCALGTCATNLALPYVQVPACASLPNMGEVRLAIGAGSLNGLRINCVAGNFAPRYRYISHVYFITANDELARMELRLNDLGDLSYVSSGALVEGVEALHFSYGIDTDGDGRVNLYTDTPVLGQRENIVAVRLWLVARNLTPTPGHNDERTYSLGSFDYEVSDDLKGRKRQVYSTTITLRNVAGAREVQ